MEEDGNWYAGDIATFGDRVAAAREARGMTQKSLARHMGVALKTVEGWENDLSEPRANRLQMMGGILNVSLPWLLTGEGPGLGTEVDAPPPAVAEILTEMRLIRAELQRGAERMAVLEKRLARAVAEAA